MVLHCKTIYLFFCYFSTANKKKKAELKLKQLVGAPFRDPFHLSLKMILHTNGRPKIIRFVCLKV